jgi:hypothetical protein
MINIKKTGGTCQNTYQGQAQPHLVYKHGKQGTDERAAEITAEAHQAKAIRIFQ